METETVMETEILEVETGLETESEMMVSNWPGWIIVGDVVQLVNSLYAITSFMQTVIHVHWSQNSLVVMVNARTKDLIKILPFTLNFIKIWSTVIMGNVYKTTLLKFYV